MGGWHWVVPLDFYEKGCYRQAMFFYSPLRHLHDRKYADLVHDVAFFSVSHRHGGTHLWTSRSMITLFVYTPLGGFMIQFDDHIFQKGWWKNTNGSHLHHPRKPAHFKEVGWSRARDFSSFGRKLLRARWMRKESVAQIRPDLNFWLVKFKHERGFASILITFWRFFVVTLLIVWWNEGLHEDAVEYLCWMYPVPIHSQIRSVGSWFPPQIWAIHYHPSCDLGTPGPWP